MSTARDIINKALFATNPMWPEMTGPIGKTLRIRLPNDYRVKDEIIMLTLNDDERFMRQQRLDCIREAIKINHSDTDAKKIVSDAKAIYKFVRGKING